MLRRFLLLLAGAWLIGFGWFAATLPRPAGTEQTDAVVVLTGGAGRIDRGAEALRQGWTGQLFVSGVDRLVNPKEFSAQFQISAPQMQCCVSLGYSATDTITNAHETANWVRSHGYCSLRLVTSDWHMRRADLELRARLPKDVAMIDDAVRTDPSLRILLIEYHKYLARRIAVAMGG